MGIVLAGDRPGHVHALLYGVRAPGRGSVLAPQLAALSLPLGPLAGHPRGTGRGRDPLGGSLAGAVGHVGLLLAQGRCLARALGWPLPRPQRALPGGYAPPQLVTPGPAVGSDRSRHRAGAVAEPVATAWTPARRSAAGVAAGRAVDRRPGPTGARHRPLSDGGIAGLRSGDGPGD